MLESARLTAGPRAQKAQQVAAVATAVLGLLPHLTQHAPELSGAGQAFAKREAASHLQRAPGSTADMDARVRVLRALAATHATPASPTWWGAAAGQQGHGSSSSGGSGYASAAAAAGGAAGTTAGSLASKEEGNRLFRAREFSAAAAAYAAALAPLSAHPSTLLANCAACHLQVCEGWGWVLRLVECVWEGWRRGCSRE